MMASTLTTESKLINLGIWALRSVQMTGYLPLSLRAPLSLDLWFPSPTYFSTVLIFTFLLGWEVHYFWNVTDYQKFLPIFGPTEKLAHHYFGIVNSIVGLFFRFSALAQAPQALAFWKENCKSVDQVQLNLGYIAENMLDKECFLKIKKSLKHCVLVNFVIIFVHVILVHSYRIFRTLTDDTSYWATDSDFHVGSALWNFLIMFHTVHSIWTCFFIKIYTACFSCVAQRVQNLRHFGDGPGMAYISEIIMVKKPNKGSAPLLFQSTMQQFEIQLDKCLEAFIILEKQVASFNNYFGDKLIAEMIVCITNLVVNSFFMSLWIGRNIWRQVAMIIVPILVFAHQLYRLSSAGGELTIEAESVANSLFETVPVGQLSPDLQFKVQMLVTKIANIPPVVSARRFFTVNRHLVTSVLSAMSTFLVVLVQFRETDNTGFRLPLPPTG